MGGTQALAWEGNRLCRRLQLKAWSRKRSAAGRLAHLTATLKLTKRRRRSTFVFMPSVESSPYIRRSA